MLLMNIILFTINIVIALFTILLIFIYIKSPSFKSIPFFFNIFFCITITLDNGLRLIGVEDKKEEEERTTWCQIQGFLLSFLDKLFITSITIYSIINYIIMANPKCYDNNKNSIYFILILINILFSLILTIIFFNQGMSRSSIDHNFCYVNTTNGIKITLDTIYTIILFLIDLFCIIRILTKLCKILRESGIQSNENRKKKLRHHLYRFIFDLILNIITFGFLLFLIRKWLTFLDNNDDNKIVKDIIYILICLINELFFTINSELYKEGMRIFTCNKIEKFKKKNDEERLYPKENEDDDGDNDECDITD